MTFLPGEVTDKKPGRIIFEYNETQDRTGTSNYDFPVGNVPLLRPGNEYYLEFEGLESANNERLYIGIGDNPLQPVEPDGDTPNAEEVDSVLLYNGLHKMNSAGLIYLQDGNRRSSLIVPVVRPGDNRMWVYFSNADDLLAPWSVRIYKKAIR